MLLVMEIFEIFGKYVPLRNSAGKDGFSSHFLFIFSVTDYEIIRWVCMEKAYRLLYFFN